MKNNRIVAVLQARMGGTRLPAKVLMPIGEVPMLERVVERLERMRTIDEIVVATSVSPADDTIAAVCAAEGWHCFRGPEDDVLERTLRTAQAWQASDVLRVDADCPLFSWQQADRVVAAHVAAGNDCTHNSGAHGSGMPIGTGVEVLSLDALGTAWTDGRQPHQRESAAQFIHDDPARFRIELLHAPAELERPHLRLTVDTRADLELIRRIHGRVGPTDGVVDLREAVAVLDSDPALARWNDQSGRRAG